MTILDRLWDQIEPTVFIGKDEWLRGLDGWRVDPVEVDGDVAWVTLTNGPEFHFATFGDTRALSLRRIRAFLQPILDEHGFARTRTPRDDVRQRRFNERFGFKVEGESEFFVTYRLDRSAACQS